MIRWGRIQPKIGETQSTVTGTIRSLADRGDLAEALASVRYGNRRRQARSRVCIISGPSFSRNRTGRKMRSASLKRTLYLDPNHALAYFTLGNLALRRGDAKSAKRCFENALDSGKRLSAGGHTARIRRTDGRQVQGNHPGDDHAGGCHEILLHGSTATK